MLRSFLRYHLPTLAWATIVGLAMLWQPPKMTGFSSGPVWRAFAQSSFWRDIGLHVVIFGLLGWLLLRSLDRLEAEGRLAVARPVLVAALPAALYGLLLEIVQHAIPGRGFELQDVVANALGAWLGAWVWSLLVDDRGSLGAR